MHDTQEQPQGWQTEGQENHGTLAQQRYPPYRSGIPTQKERPFKRGWAGYSGKRDWHDTGVIEFRPSLLGEMQGHGVGLNTDSSDQDLKPCA